MSSRTENTTAKIAAASSGPRQLSTMLSPELLSDMVEQLTLIQAVCGDRRWGQRMRSIPNAIELPQAAAQFLRNFRTRLDRRLRTPPPPARKLIEIFAIRAIAPNRQPCALRQSGQQAQVRRTQCQPQLALPLQPVCQRKPFVFRTFAGDGLVAQVGQRRCRDWNGKLGGFAAPPEPK